MIGSLLLYDLSGDTQRAAPPDVLVAILMAGENTDQTSAYARRWQPHVPTAAFVGIGLSSPVQRTDSLRLRRMADRAATDRSVSSCRTILLGAGEAGWLAVDLMLRGGLQGTGVLGLDVPLGSSLPRCFARTRVIVRLVQRDAGKGGFQALVGQLQRQAVDVRGVTVPAASQAGPEIALRAAGAFLAELVARASSFGANSCAAGYRSRT